MSKWDPKPLLPYTTEIDVVITKGDKCKIERMQYGHFLNMKKHQGFRYQSFQPGYHGYTQNV